MDKKKIGKAALITGAVLGTTFVVMRQIAKKQYPKSVYDDKPEEKNPMEGKKVVFVECEDDEVNADGKRGHLEAVGTIEHIPTFYEKYIKRGFDVVVSFGGIVALAPVFAISALAIKIDDPGPVIFKQKRITSQKSFYRMMKLRSMSVNTPNNVPTHMLKNGGITKVGAILRKTSADELPQLFNIFEGSMSLIGPRPALWNQDYLTAERDKYGANDVKAGLTGWAQINGRDELEIPEKARLDGEYVAALKKSSWSGFMMDMKCFFGSISAVLKRDGIVEGGTGEMAKIGRHYTDGKTAEELIGHIGFGEPVTVDTETTKKVLITGAGSYIGEYFKEYAKEKYPALEISTLDMLDPDWRECDFSEYDIVYHVAGIAHADVGNVDDKTKEKYYSVNTDFAVEVCAKAKAEGVKEFVFMSSMIVYGDSAPYGKSKIVDEFTIPSPANFYGDSKLQADVAVRDFADDSYKVLVIRPPMIYGKGSKGNYPTLAKLAKKLPVFPDVDNQRSMLHIDNLCEFLCQVMLIQEIKENAVVLIPQNTEWTKTSEMVKEIAEVSGKSMKILGIMKPAVAIGGKVPGKIGGLVNKAFGNSCYARSMSVYSGINYQNISLAESIEKTEKEDNNVILYRCCDDNYSKYSVLMSVYFKEKPDYLKLSIESIINQTLKPEQIVLVEDGPLCEDLETIVKEYEDKYSDLFTIVRLSENGGLGNALNIGMKHCRNEFVARMDTDDIALPNRCEKELRVFENDPSLAIVGGQINEFIDEPSNIVSSRIVPTNYDDIKKFARRRSPFNHPTVMYRKSVIESLNGYQTSGRKEDLDLFVRLLNEGHKAKNLEDVVLLYRSNVDNLARRKTWKNCSEYIDIMYGFYKKGYCGLNDLAYVVLGQTAMYITPTKVTALLSNKFLRKKA